MNKSIKNRIGESKHSLTIQSAKLKMDTVEHSRILSSILDAEVRSEDNFQFPLVPPFSAQIYSFDASM